MPCCTRAARPAGAAVRDRIIAECRGNPLALLELPREWTLGQLAGGFGLPDAPLLAGRIEQAYVYRLRSLPGEHAAPAARGRRRTAGRRHLLWRAADRLGIDAAAAPAAEEHGLIEFGARVTFRHPLVRRRPTDPRHPGTRGRCTWRWRRRPTGAIPDRRAWHLAAAAAGRTSEVASRAERSAGRAQARGGFAAAAAFLQRSVCADGRTRASGRRALAAAQSQPAGGRPGCRSRDCWPRPRLELDDYRSPGATCWKGEIAFASGHGSDAPPLLLNAAQQLEPLDWARPRRPTWTLGGGDVRRATRRRRQPSRSARPQLGPRRTKARAPRRTASSRA